MMKKKFFLTLILLASTLCAYEFKSATIEARFSDFYPSSNLLQDVYHHGGIDYQITGTVPIWQGINVWGAVDYFHRQGNSLYEHNKTTIQIVPLTLGLKYLYPIWMFTPYGGLGMKYFFLHVHNHSPNVKKVVNKNGMGGVIEIGSLFSPIEHFILDVYVSYSLKRFNAPHINRSNVKANSLNVSGWNFGGGFGYQF